MSGSSADTNTTEADLAGDANDPVLKAFELLEASDGFYEDEDLDSSDEESEDDESYDDEEDEGDEPSDDDSEEDADSADDEDADGTDENDEGQTDRDVGFAKSKRFRQMNEQLKAAKSKAEKLEAVESALAQVGIEIDGLEDGLEVLRALRDPSAPGAMKTLAPHLEAIANMSGLGQLDDDLAEDLANQDISEKRARELQAMRAKSKAQDAANRDAAARNTTRAAEQAVGTLYREFETSDPDWSKKKDLTETKAQSLFGAFRSKNGRVPTIEEGVSLIRAAKSSIDELLPKARVRKPESKVVTPGTKATKKTGKTQPSNLESSDDYFDLVEKILAGK